MFANKLTRRLGAGSKVTAITVKGVFIAFAAAPFVWIYFYGGQYLGRDNAHRLSEASAGKAEGGLPPSQSMPESPRQPVTSSGKGWVASTMYTNSRFGFRVAYPAGVLYGQGESENGDGEAFASKNGRFLLTAWASPRVGDETIGELYEQEGRGFVGLDKKIFVTYKRQKGNWFIVSGNYGDDGIYRKTLLAAGYIARIEMRWKLSETEEWRSTMESVQLTEGR